MQVLQLKLNFSKLKFATFLQGLNLSVNYKLITNYLLKQVV